MANTFQLIASSTVGSGGAASIGFTSIPSTYTDLCLQYSLRNVNETNGSIYLSINGSTASLSFKHIYGSGAAAASGSGTNEAGLTNPNTYTASTFSSGSIYLPNYAGSTNKSYSIDSVNENNATTAYSVLLAGLWSSTSAINAISLAPLSNNLAQYSTAYLYGVSKS